MLIDPIPTLLPLVDVGPVVYHEGIDVYMVTTYEECARVLGNARAFQQPALMWETLFGAPTMLGVDGPRHKELRSVWSQAFKREQVRSRCEDLVREVVREHSQSVCQRVAAGEQVEVVRSMARLIPTDVIAELCGIPRADKKDFIHWSDQLAQIFSAQAASGERRDELNRVGAMGVASLNEYVAGQLRAGTHDNAADLIGEMIRSDVPMSAEEMVASVTLLIFAGNDTTSNLLSNALWTFSHHPEQWEMLKRDRSLIPAAIDEVNRWLSVAQTDWRIAVEGAEVAGVPIPTGSTVLTLVGVANRDPSRWSDPNEFNIQREFKRNLGFGFGAHQCLGMNLAKLEVETWLNHMLDSLPAWRVADTQWGVAFGAPRGPAALVIEAQNSSGSETAGEMVGADA
jgi:cytochrome P450